MIRYILALFFLFSVIHIKAQQEPISALFWNSYSYFNPANSGFEHDLFLNIQGRDHFSSVDGNPFTLWVNADMKFKEKNGLGLGMMYEEVGLFKFYKLNINYNRQFHFADIHTISVGAALGAKRAHFDVNGVIANDPIDPVVPGEEQSNVVPDLRLGILYGIGQFNFGFSVLNAENSELEFGELAVYPFYQYYSTMLSVRFKVGDALDLIPRMFFFWDENTQAFNNYQINLTSEIKEVATLGLSVRNDNSISLIAGVRIKSRFNIQYAYDPQNTGDIAQSHSHELSLSYFIDQKS